jgi:hypothetical protein
MQLGVTTLWTTQRSISIDRDRRDLRLTTVIAVTVTLNSKINLKLARARQPPRPQAVAARPPLRLRPGGPPSLRPAAGRRLPVARRSRDSRHGHRPSHGASSGCRH